VLARRDRALIAFAAISGARVAALASFQLGDIDLEAGLVRHDARHVRSKFSKTFTTFFMPIGGGALEIVQDWIAELQGEHLWGLADPLFPATQMGLGESGGFIATGLSRNGWSNSNPVREIFARAFAAAGLPYYNPHSFRAMLVSHAFALGLSVEHMKAWSQNLGHTEMLTTLTSYGSIPAQRQGELIRQSAQAKAGDDWTMDADVQALLKAIAAKAQSSPL
jgi:integrase